jgi:nitrogen regulatory protein PII 1
MKMIRAIIRPEKEDEVRAALEQAGLVGLTKLAVSGRGKQGGIQVGSARYDELPKTMLLLVVEDGDADRAMTTIQRAAFTGNFGDGVIFVSEVEAAYTIRTAAPGL